MTATKTAFEQFWLLVFGVLRLDRHTFESIHHLPFSLVTSIVVVFLAALSQGIGQSAVLFINRVRPLRFILSLAIATLSFWQVFACCLVGWLVFQISQRAIGRPLAAFTRMLTKKVAGVDI